MSPQPQLLASLFDIKRSLLSIRFLLYFFLCCCSFASQHTTPSSSSGMDDNNTTTEAPCGEEEPQNKQLVPWSFCNPFTGTPFSLEVRPLYIAGHTVHIHQRPWAPSSTSAEPEGPSYPKTIGGVLWDAGYALSKYLEYKFPHMGLSGKQIIELGSGTGIVGMVAAILGGTVVLTDGDDLALENLQRNLDHNHHLQIAERTSVLKLQWGEELPPEVIAKASNRPYDYVLCSDLVYGDNRAFGVFRALLSSLLQLCGAQTQVLFAYQPRQPAHESRFFRWSAKHFHIHQEDASSFPLELQTRGLQIFIFQKKLPNFNLNND